MEENNDKFIIGDNTDGYRRSATDYNLDLFAEKKRPADEPKPQPTAAKPAHNRTKPPLGAKKSSARAQSFFARKPSQPVPEKKGPTVKRHGKPPIPTNVMKKVQQPKRQPPEVDERSLSENERRRLHAEQRRAQRRRKMLMQ